MPGLREPRGSHERRRFDVREVGTTAFTHRSYPNEHRFQDDQDPVQRHQRLRDCPLLPAGLVCPKQYPAIINHCRRLLDRLEVVAWSLFPLKFCLLDLV